MTYAQVPTPKQNANPAHVIIAWIFAIFSLLYFLPWAIAASRGKSNAAAIALLNLFLGWTVIGWIAALIMACGAESGAGTVVVTQMSVNVSQPHPAAFAPPPYGALQQQLPQGYAQLQDAQPPQYAQPQYAQPQAVLPPQQQGYDPTPYQQAPNEYGQPPSAR